MIDFGISQECVALLMSIYQQTSYPFTHRGVTHAVGTKPGIRQGCKAAPRLWLLYLGRLMYQLIDSTENDWVRLCNTVFADDWLSAIESLEA